MRENSNGFKLHYLNDGENDNDDEEEETDVEYKSVKEVVVTGRVHFVTNTTAGSQTGISKLI